MIRIIFTVLLALAAAVPGAALAQHGAGGAALPSLAAFLKSRLPAAQADLVMRSAAANGLLGEPGQNTFFVPSTTALLAQDIPAPIDDGRGLEKFAWDETFPYHVVRGALTRKELGQAGILTTL